MDSITDGVVSIDNDGIITSWNRGAARLFGYTADEVLGRQSTEVLIIDDIYDRFKIRRAAVKYGSWKGTLKYQHRDGRTVEVLASISSLRDSSNRSTGLVVIYQEATDLNRVQANYAQSISKERAASRRAETLKQRNHELQVLNRTKDEFIAIASHQLRTPATGVKQYVGMILQGFGDPVTGTNRHLLEQAYESNQRQLRIIDDILHVAQIDMDKVALDRQPTDVTALVRDIMDEQTESFKRRGHQPMAEFPPQPLIAHIDAARIRMAIGNIIDNANKYTPTGKDVTVIVTAPDSRNVLIKVIDKGVGIARANLDKLFQKFSRIDNPLSVEVGGNGLGLYWSKKIIDLHGGSITVVSQLKKGTTFTVSLPLGGTTS